MLFIIKGIIMQKIIISLFLSFSISSFAAPVDVKKSTINWKGTKITSDEHSGKIGIKSGDFQEKDGKLVGGEVVADMNDIICEDLKDPEYNGKLVTHLKSPDFFDAKNHPYSNLKITKVEGNKATGELTIKGKKNPVSFAYEKTKEGSYKGKLVFDRTKFGIVFNSGNFFKDLKDKVINDDVQLSFEIYPEAQKEKK